MLNRRRFLQRVGAAAPVSMVSVAGSLSAGRQADDPAPDEPRVFLREDFHHMSGITPPLTKADVTKTVDLVARTSVNTLIFQLAPREECAFTTPRSDRCMGATWANGTMR